MARIYARSSRGLKPALVSPVRTTRSHAMHDAHLKNPRETTHTPSQSSRMAPGRPTYPRRSLAVPTAQQGGAAGEDTSGDEADNDEDEEDEDDEDNDDEPESFAPSRARRMHKTGRKISPSQAEEDLFDNDDDDDDDDDDAFYEAVNDFSDSDGGLHEESEEQLEAFDEQDILHEFEAFDEQEAALHEFLDSIDGLSAVGYGGDLDTFEALTAFSDDSGSSTDATVQRRVHFHSDIEQRTNMLSGSLSPLLTRALLPSALPEDAGVLGDTPMSQSSMVGTGTDPWGFQSSASPQQRGSFYEDSDSDATDEDLPAEAHTTPSALHHSPVELGPAAPSSPISQRKRSSRRRGPPLGTFQVDKDKMWGVFDPDKKKIVMLAAPETGRFDWLAERHTGSDDSGDETPEASPRQLLDESDESVISSQETPGTADLMLASLTSPANANGDHGQTTGPVEAFFPRLFQAAGDYLVSPEMLDDLDFADERDLPLSMTDLIAFDDEDDSDGDESPTSPAIYMPPVHELFGSRSVHEQFPHLNNHNVTAFRQSTDPARISNRTTPALPSIGVVQNRLQATDTPTPSRKRKAAPYTGKLYEGVTPASRVLHTPKRRKVTI